METTDESEKPITLEQCRQSFADSQQKLFQSKKRRESIRIEAVPSSGSASPEKGSEKTARTSSMTSNSSDAKKEYSIFQLPGDILASIASSLRLL